MSGRQVTKTAFGAARCIVKETCGNDEQTQRLLQRRHMPGRRLDGAFFHQVKGWLRLPREAE
jgi:hypothetical protein